MSFREGKYCTSIQMINFEQRCCRVSIIGSGLDQAPLLIQKIRDELQQHKIPALHQHCSESVLEYWLTESPALDALMQKLHQELIEKL